MVKLHTFAFEIHSTAVCVLFSLRLKLRLKLQFQSGISKSLDFPLTVIENFLNLKPPLKMSRSDTDKVNVYIISYSY